jgi:hypothetical protein
VTAFTIPKLPWITICPQTFFDRQMAAGGQRNLDWSTTAGLRDRYQPQPGGSYIEAMKTISSTLFHELLHVLQADYGKSGHGDFVS